ncbi:hypothetical protein POK33_13165 [Burkholderia cenocepacia]|uniref:hypothetical protein n=1 Tax=Burkholderia cenocepacia TaxID=95486 RepID=UPI0023B99A31|nr:hypothetical protein [Burkholderia cenocepacia]MDF0501670.1 hypothetical protein [Burkholderia cenocepacia]
MTTDINDIPPWEGPDLLVEAREAARKAGEAAEFTRSPSDAKPLAPRKERTWADVEAGCASAESKAADSIQTPTRKLPAWLQKARQENAKISARINVLGRVSGLVFRSPARSSFLTGEGRGQAGKPLTADFDLPFCPTQGDCGHSRSPSD